MGISSRLFYGSMGRHSLFVGVCRMTKAIGFGPVLHWDKYAVKMYINLLMWEFEFEWRWEDEPHGN